MNKAKTRPHTQGLLSAAYALHAFKTKGRHFALERYDIAKQCASNAEAEGELSQASRIYRKLFKLAWLICPDDDRIKAFFATKAKELAERAEAKDQLLKQRS